MQIDTELSPWVVKGGTAYCTYCGIAYQFELDMRDSHVPTCEYRAALNTRRPATESMLRGYVRSRQLLTEDTSI